MLFFDLQEAGNRMYAARKRMGLTQAEVAEHAGLSDRGYADIERGKVNVRLNTLLSICQTLRVTPNDLLVVEQDELLLAKESVLLNKLHNCPARDKEIALRILSAYIHSVEEQKALHPM